MGKYSLIGLAVVGGLLLWAGSAGAGSPSPGLTLLTLQRDGRPSEGLTQMVAHRLEQLGEEPAQRPLLSSEQSCESASCLGSVAQRLRAQRLLGGSVVTNATRRYFVKLFLYESAGRGSPLVQDSTCGDCSEKQLGALLASLAAKLLEQRGSLTPPSPTGPLRAPTPLVGNSQEPSLDRRASELPDLLKVQMSATAKTKEAADAALRQGESNGKALDMLRSQQERTKESLDRLREASEKTSAQIDKLREITDKSKDSSDRGREQIEHSRENLDRLRESVDKTRALAESGRLAAESAKALTERLQKGTEQAAMAADRARSQSETTAATVSRATASLDAAREQVDKLHPTIDKVRAAAESALKESQEAKKESQESKESAKQTGLLVEKTLAQVEQLQALSGDLKAALGNVEPLRAAAEQTLLTVRSNVTESQRLLSVAQVERKAADEARVRAEQALQAVKVRQARTGLSRGRKAAVGVLGALGVVVLGGAVTATALDGAYYGGCSYDGRMQTACALHLTGYATAGYTVGAILVGGALLTALIPAQESGAP